MLTFTQKEEADRKAAEEARRKQKEAEEKAKKEEEERQERKKVKTFPPLSVFVTVRNVKLGTVCKVIEETTPLFPSPVGSYRVVYYFGDCSGPLILTCERLS